LPTHGRPENGCEQNPEKDHFTTVVLFTFSIRSKYMAEISIQKKENSKWLPLVIGLVLAAGAAWWIMSSRARVNGVGGPDAMGPNEGYTASGAPVMMPPRDGVITDFATLMRPTTENTFIGQSVVLSSIPVIDAVSDRGFWAGTGNITNNPGENVFVVRGNQNASFTAPNGSVRRGESVMIYGVVQKTPGDLTANATGWTLTSATQSELAKRPFYIMADSVRLVAR